MYTHYIKPGLGKVLPSVGHIINYEPSPALIKKAILWNTSVYPLVFERVWVVLCFLSIKVFWFKWNYENSLLIFRSKNFFYWIMFYKELKIRQILLLFGIMLYPLSLKLWDFLIRRIRNKVSKFVLSSTWWWLQEFNLVACRILW